MCVSWSSCVFASLRIYGSRLSVPSGIFIGCGWGFCVAMVHLLLNSSHFLVLWHFPCGAGGFVTEVSSLIPRFEFPWLNDILNLLFILT